MKLRVRYSDDIAIIEVSGRININSSKLIETVGVLLDEGNKKIVIDIQEVDFVDYNGLSVLAIAYKSSLNNKAAMKLCGVSLHIMELLRVVKLDEVFEVYADIEEALESFKTKEAARDNKPQALQQHLRRKFTRIDIDIPISYRILRTATNRGESHLYTGRIANISGAGVFIRTINIFPPGSRVELEVGLGRKKNTNILTGAVLWLADKSLQPDLYPGMGVAFSGITPHMQEEIIEFIEKHTVHRRG